MRHLPQMRLVLLALVAALRVVKSAVNHRRREVRGSLADRRSGLGGWGRLSSRSSCVWRFTRFDGPVSDVFYPRADQPALRQISLVWGVGARLRIVAIRLGNSWTKRPWIMPSRAA